MRPRFRFIKVREKAKEAESNLINTGIYAFTSEIFDFIGAELDIPSVLNSMVAEGYSINAQEIDGTWLDVVYPWDILSLNDAVLRQMPAKLGGTIETGVVLKGLVSVGEGTIIRSNCYIVGPAIIGGNCEIGPNTCIQAATSIGDNVAISPFTEIRNSVIGDDVNIGPSCTIHDSVIDKGCVIKGHFTAYSSQTEVKINDEHYLANIGAMLGEGCSLGNNVVAQPGVIIGNYSQVQPLKLVSGRLPDKSLVL